VRGGESEEFGLKCAALFSCVSVYRITKHDMNFNYCAGKNIDCFAAFLVRPETESEMEEKSNDEIECGVPEQCGRMCRLARK
jgi:hypothetical protein